MSRATTSGNAIMDNRDYPLTQAFPPLQGVTDARRAIRHKRNGISPKLEVIDKGHCSEAHPTPLLFVHGGEYAAWCWDEHFLDFFADKGYRALAVILRGHGGSPNSKRLRSCSIADYVEDVCSVADDLTATPVVIGPRWAVHRAEVS